VLLATTLLTLITLAAALTGLVTVGAAAAAAAYRQYTDDLPPVSDVGNRNVFKTTRILDRNGDLLYELFDQNAGKRTVVHLADMAPEFVDAELAVEDPTFYDNPGIDPKGIARAAYQLVSSRSVQSGGSTITQQLIRNVLFDPQERTAISLDRKVKEAVLAVELNNRYSKDQILEWYLNEISYGNLSYGVAAAAATYFNKEPGELTLAQSAMLAGLPQAPSIYDPFTNVDAVKRRQVEVLDLMARHGFISQAEADETKEEPLQLVSPDNAGTPMRYPHWVFYVRSVLEEMYGPKQLLSAGLTVYTTLDPHLQDIAQDDINLNIPALRSQNANNAALVAIEPQLGEILAMVGSPDFNDTSIDGQVNNAVALHQPGSSIKPIVYLASFLKGFSPATIVQDSPLSLPDGAGGTWKPQNFDLRFRGPVTLRRALGNSLNIPAVRVLQFVGLDNAISLARKMGLTSLLDPSNYGLSFVLGGGDVRLVELATAYTVLADGGDQVAVSPILKVLDSEGNVIFQHQATRQSVVDPRAVYLVSSILSDNSARTETFGVNNPLRLKNDRPAAAKTGSTDDYRDSWTMGYTPSLVTGVWVGRSDHQPMRVSGSSGAGLIWNNFMERALADWPFEPFDPPTGVVRERICTGPPPDEGEPCPSVQDWFLEERAPSAQAKFAARVYALDRVTGQLADRDTPYDDIILKTFRPSLNGDTGLPPADYSARAGAAHPWEILPATLIPTVLPTSTPTPGPSPTPSPGPSPTETATPTPRPSLTPVPTRTPIPFELLPAPIAPTVRVSEPRAGQVVSGTIAIEGTVSSADLNSYRVQYDQANITGQWTTVREAEGTTSVADNQLDFWDTRTVPDGSYWIHVTGVSDTGGVAQAGVVVIVRNAGR
jgi:1A family penicillin-binding protein